ncbi:MAG: ABC transporter permease [Methanobacteriaceae archaeon]|nr:ABC transporter permease [Methanobacteriaceae archaeon]
MFSSAFLLSGVFWPLQAIPDWLRPLSYLVPPTYAVDACLAVMLKGWGGWIESGRISWHW